MPRVIVSPTFFPGHQNRGLLEGEGRKEENKAGMIPFFPPASSFSCPDSFLSKQSECACCVSCATQGACQGVFNIFFQQHFNPAALTSLARPSIFAKPPLPPPPRFRQKELQFREIFALLCISPFVLLSICFGKEQKLRGKKAWELLQ